VLVEHRVDDVDEGLVAVEHPVAAGEQVTLEPALAEVLGEDLHHAPVHRQVIVAVQHLCLPHAVGDLEHVAEAVGGGLVGPHQAKALGVARDDVAQEASEHACGLARARARPRDIDRVIAKVGHLQIAQQEASVGVRVGAHAPLPLGCQRRQLGTEGPALVEQLLGLIGAHPLLELREVLGL
jgi:hypothetical protein